MPVVPLGTQAYARASSLQPETRLVNLFIEEDVSGASPDKAMRLQRPGLTRIGAYTGAIRGIFQSDNPQSTVPLIVAGDDLLSIVDGDAVSIGAVPNDGLAVRIEATFERVCVLSAGEIWSWDGSTYAEIAMPDDESVVDLDVLNGYVVFLTATGKFYWLVPGETEVAALDFATTEALPDGAVAVRRLRDDLFFFGSQTIEVWQTTGDADATFQRASGRLVDRGCMSRDSVAVFDNSLVWVGEDGIVYRMAEVPERISTFGIEEKLKDRTDEPSAFVFTSLGHKFYVLRIPGQGTFGYDAATKLWSEFASVDQTYWRVAVGRDAPLGALCGDATGALFRLDPQSSLDDGEPFLRLVTGTVAIPPTPVANSSLAIGVGSDDEAIFELRWNDPRIGWSDAITLTARGEGDILNAWRLGVARAPSRTFEISTVAPTKIRISGAVANEAWRV